VGQALTSDVRISDIKFIDLKSKIGDVQALFVFGVGDGVIYRTLTSWLKQNDQRYLVFIEEQEEVFLRAKESSLSKDPKVRLFYWKKGDEEIFQQISWEFVFLRFGYAVLESHNTEVAHEFFTRLEHYHRGVDLLASDCEDMGLKVLTNAIKNLEALSFSRQGQTTEARCAGMPAIVCGAGPSLNSAIPLLAQLKDKALIIAGGSAIRALNAQGIQPHICAGIDPEPPQRRFLEQDSFEAPFFYQGRFSKELLPKVQGPLMWMADSGSYPLEGWLAAECGIFTERFDAGWTVSNFCTAIAAHLGCSTIIFVGMDFSCGPDAIYASNIPGEENCSELIELEKDKLYSKRDWMMSAEWMGAFAQSHPEITWINASSSGIELQGIQRRDFAESVETFLAGQWDVQGIVQMLVMQAPVSKVSSEKVAEVRRRIKESFEKSLQLCDALLKVWEKYYPNSPLEKGDYVVLDVELEQEVCYRCFLLPLWSVWKKPILRASFHPLGQHIHRLLFFKKAIEKHLPHLRSYQKHG
jgi:hypothetical protein